MKYTIVYKLPEGVDEDLDEYPYYTAIGVEAPRGHQGAHRAVIQGRQEAFESTLADVGCGKVRLNDIKMIICIADNEVRYFGFQTGFE